MQEKFVLFMVLVLLVTPFWAMSIRPASSTGTPIFSQNFDDEPTGAIPQGWTNNNVSLSSWTVNDTVYHGSSGKCAKYVDMASFPGGSAQVEMNFEKQYGFLEFSFAVMAENPEYFSFYIDDGTSMYRGANIYLLPWMELAYYDGSYHYLCPFSLNTWYEIRMVISVPTNTYDIYVDGSLVAQGAHFRRFGQAAYLTKIQVGGNSYETPSAYIDDIALTNIQTDLTLLQVVDPITADHSFNFSEAEKSVGDTFMVNVTIANVQEMVCWQFALQWNPNLLECVNATIPSDNVFAYWNVPDEPLIVGGPDMSHMGLVVYGAGITYPDRIGFNGSGVLAQVEFRILNKGGQSDLSFVSIGTDTFLLSDDLSDIQFIPISAQYSYSGSGIPGDVNMDGTVNMRDIAILIILFNITPYSTNWNPNADINNDGVINMRDIAIALVNFNRHM